MQQHQSTRDVKDEDPAQALTNACKESKMLVEARRPLKQDIAKLIAPYVGELDEAPPFKQFEMAIMAIINSAKEYLTKDDMDRWIAGTFSYFKRGGGRHLVYDNYRGMHESYDAPIIIRTDDMDHHGHAVPGYNVRPSIARLRVKHYFEPPRKGVFRFLDLPAELRNRIYSMLLHFSDASVKVSDGTTYTNTSLRCHACIVQETDKQRHVWWCNYRLADSEPSQIIGSLFLTCHQIYSEAASIFYGSNKFYFWRVNSIGQLARRLSANQLKLIKRIHLNMSGPRDLDDIVTSLTLATNAFDKLTPLDELAFTISDQSWLDEWGTVGTYEDIPVLQDLQKLAAKAKTVKVYPASKHDSYDTFSSFIRK